MPIQDYKLTPENGYLDATTFPNPSNGTQSREQLNNLPIQLLAVINDLKDKLQSIVDGSSGGDIVLSTAITDLDGTSVRAQIKSLRDKVKSLTDGSSGADFINATAISGLEGTTVQTLLRALKALADYLQEQINSTIETLGGKASTAYVDEKNQGLQNQINTNNSNISTLGSAKLDKSTYNAQVINAGNSNAEIVDARGTFSILKDRLGNVDTQLAESPQQINVKYPPIPMVRCEVDGTTDDTTAFNNIYQYAYDNGKSVFIGGVMRITGAIGKNITLTTNKSFPSIIGNKAMAVTNNLGTKEQDGSIILYDGVGGSALQINNLSLTNLFYGGTIKDIAIVKKNGDQSTDNSIGLDLRGCVDYRLYNVTCIGFDIGFKNKYGWSWDAYGFTSVRNNIGVLLDDNSNAVGFHGSQIHQNKINVKIISGTNITFNKVTLEGGNSIGAVITSGAIPSPSSIKFDSCYFEANIKNFVIGKDENGVSSTDRVKNISINNCNFSTPGIVPIELDNVSDVRISNIEWGQSTPLFSTTANTSKVSIDNYADQFQSDLGDRYSKQRRVGVFNRVNLLPNGFLDFPDLTSFKRGGLVADFDTTTFLNEKVVKITVPTGTATNVNTRMIVKIDPKMVGKRLLFSATAQKDSGLTASFTAYNSAFSGISGASVAIPESIGKVGFYFTCPNDDYINVSIVLANSSGVTKYCYIKAMVLVENGVGEIEPNPLDYLSSLSGAIAATTTGVIVPLPGWTWDMYEVIVTPRANVTAYVTKDANQFTITTVGGNGTVFYLIIPKCGMFI